MAPNRRGVFPLSDKKAVDIGRLIREGTLVDEAIRKATRDALLNHKRLGDPVVGWKDGKVVWIPADQIEVDEEPTTPVRDGA
jgi:hypothetical protein